MGRLDIMGNGYNSYVAKNRRGPKGSATNIVAAKPRFDDALFRDYREEKRATRDKHDAPSRH
jgi:hypothetical protein